MEVETYSKATPDPKITFGANGPRDAVACGDPHRTEAFIDERLDSMRICCQFLLGHDPSPIQHTRRLPPKRSFIIVSTCPHLVTIAAQSANKNTNTRNL